MSDDLKNIYKQANMSDAFFDVSVPVDIWRAQRKEDYQKQVFILQPHPGYSKKNPNGGPDMIRPPDVKVEVVDGKKIVRGCRCIKGHDRGVSLFDCKITWMGTSWLNYLIPAGTEIPPGLMVTRDAKNSRTGATHYTLGPKDDMPEELFIQTLKIIALKAVLVK